MAEGLHGASVRPTTPNHQRRLPSTRVLAQGQPVPIQTSTQRFSSNIGPLSPVNQNGSFAWDRIIKRGKLERRVKKKGAWKASWKPAYLVLRPNLLSVYKDADETELRASITLSDVTAVATVKKSHHDNVFGIFSPSKNYHFSGANARETSDWIAILRLEAHTEEQTDLSPPDAGFRHMEGQGYDTTDISADEDLDAPASPKVLQWTMRGQKTRLMPQANSDPRRLSGLAPYPSGNESFVTSQSDFSDGLGSSFPGPKSYLSSSTPVQPSTLAPILDDVRSTPKPVLNRNTSYLSDTTGQPLPGSKNAPKPQQQIPTHDPSRVVRQGYLKLSKTVSGVKQWKSIWAVLRISSLSFYKSNNEYSPILILPLYTIIEAAEIERKDKYNCFQVIGEEKTYKLRTESEDELESWLGAFKSLLVKQEAERSSRSRGQSMNGLVEAAGSQQVRHQRPVQPTSRDGMNSITAQMRGASFTDAQPKRIVSPPATGLTSAPA